MKKLLLALAIVVCAVQAQAKVSSTITLTSAYLWRGLSFSSTETGAATTSTATSSGAIQGSIDYTDDSGLMGGIWASNIAGAAHEFDQYIGYGTTINDINLSVMAFRFGYMLYPPANSMEYSLNASWKGLKFMFGYMPKWFQVDSTSMYLSLGYTVAIDTNLGAVLTVGNTTFGNEGNVGYANYADWKAALQYTNEGWTTEIGLTDTNMQSVDGTGTKTAMDYTEKSYVSISKTF
jgi:uncharacterized protein (TIGR02001 family)